MAEYIRISFGVKESMNNIDVSENQRRSDHPQSITPSGFFGDGPENIIELENFMTPEELNFLITSARNIKYWDYTEDQVNEEGTVIYDSSYWKDRVATRASLDKNDPNIGPIIERLQERLKEKIESLWNVKIQATGTTIVKWKPGQFQKPHADKELWEGEDRGKPNAFPWYDIASLFYLNDDYSGGELYFPVQGVQLKPKAGAAYFFPGDMNYIHGVTEVEGSDRYTCPFFWTILEHTNKDKND